MIERLLPSAVASADTRGDLEVELFPEEVRSMGRAVEKRRREFVTGRACARLALGRLGIAPTAIANGERGEPLWPAGVVGSITHCAGYRGCAVARVADVRSLGIDAEVNAPLPAGVLRRVAFGRERELEGTHEGTCLDRLLFSAKEAVYKAWYPMMGRGLAFEDVQISLDPPAAAFSATLGIAGPTIDGRGVSELTGRWCVEHDLICTAVVVA